MSLKEIKEAFDKKFEGRAYLIGDPVWNNQTKTFYVLAGVHGCMCRIEFSVRRTP